MVSFDYGWTVLGHHYYGTSMFSGHTKAYANGFLDNAFPPDQPYAKANAWIGDTFTVVTAPGWVGPVYMNFTLELDGSGTK